jgi:uncharacterized protein YciI/quercetin dioxygenase-like cupin family protein
MTRNLSYVPDAFDTLTVVFLTTGPRAGEFADADDDCPDELQEQHLAHLASMFERGALAVAGPVGRDDDDEVRGLCLYRSGIDEATALASADPAVQAGRLAVEARVWRLPAGYLSFPKQGVPWWRRRTTGYSVLDARTLEGRRKLVAHELGARAIKLNRFDNEPHQAGKEHDERETGQEEIYIPVAGTGYIVIDGDHVTLEPGVFVLVEPESTRQVIAGPAGLSYVIVGAEIVT